MIDFSVPRAGIAAAEASLNQTAAKLAQSGFSGGGDSVDLSTDAVALIEAQNDVQANVKVIQTEDQVSQSLLKLVG